MTGVTVCPGGPALVGEGPVWDEERQCLWWVDVFAPAVHRFSDGHHQTFAMPELAGCVAVAEDGCLIVAMESGLFTFRPGVDAVPSFLSAPPDLPATHRFNDLVVDGEGRLIVGTMRKSQSGPAEPTGVLYAYAGGSWTVLAEGFWTINGLAFSPDSARLYWSDSHASQQRVWSAPYCARSATIGSADVFVDMRHHRGRPDGAAVDAEGGYWLAAVDGGCLHRFTASGELSRTIDLPTRFPTKPAFGGPEFDTLFVTTMSVREDQANVYSGKLLALNIGTIGVRMPLVKSPLSEQ